MKKFIIAALAASIISTPVMAAPFQRNDHRATAAQQMDHRNDYRQVQNRGWNKGAHFDNRHVQNRRWVRGDRFDYRQARNYRVISNPRAYHFRDAPNGYRWVQSGNDAILIGITSGIVASVLSNVFR
jgi:Ni/Co efflux regulator RcnB